MLWNVGRGPCANEMKMDSTESSGQHKVQDNIFVLIIVYVVDCATPAVIGPFQNDV